MAQSVSYSGSNLSLKLVTCGSDRLSCEFEQETLKFKLIIKFKLKTLADLISQLVVLTL